MTRAASILFLFLSLIARAASPFSIAHWSDCHSGAFIDRTNAQQLLSFVVAHTNDGDLNFKGMVLTGDIFEQLPRYYTPGDQFYSSNVWQFSELTNDLRAFTTNGLFLLACNGNHDADDFSGVMGTWTGTHTNSIDYAYTNVFTPAFYSNQTAPGLIYFTNSTPGDTRQMAVGYTNQGVKLLFTTYSSSFTNDRGGVSAPVDIRAQFLPQTQWVSNQLAIHPDYNGIVLTHYMLAFDVTSTPINGLEHLARPYPFFHTNDYNFYRNIGPSGIAFEQGLGDNTNAMLVLSGHTQALRKGHLMQPRRGGGAVDVQALNMQSSVNISGLVNGQAVSVLTFYPDLGKMRVRTFNTLTGESLNNNSTAMIRYGSAPNGDTTTNTFQHTWTVPFAVPQQKRMFRLR
jgi:hypothetical protein